MAPVHRIAVIVLRATDVTKGMGLQLGSFCFYEGSTGSLLRIAKYMKNRVLKPDINQQDVFIARGLDRCIKIATRMPKQI